MAAAVIWIIGGFSNTMQHLAYLKSKNTGITYATMPVDVHSHWKVLTALHLAKNKINEPCISRSNISVNLYLRNSRLKDLSGTSVQLSSNTELFLEVDFIGFCCFSTSHRVDFMSFLLED